MVALVQFGFGCRRKLGRAGYELSPFLHTLQSHPLRLSISFESRGPRGVRVIGCRAATGPDYLPMIRLTSRLTGCRLSIRAAIRPGSSTIRFVAVPTDRRNSQTQVRRSTTGVASVGVPGSGGIRVCAAGWQQPLGQAP